MLAAYSAITLVIVSPLFNYAAAGTASFEGDSRLIIWTLAWDAHSLLTGQPLFGASIYYPDPSGLAWAEHHLGMALFALPIQVITNNPVIAYWCLWLASFPLNALSMWALARRITGDAAASFVAGLVFGFCFFRMHHAPGHLQLLWTWALPLIPLALERWLDQPTMARASLLTVLVLVQALTSGYTAVMTALLVLTTALVLLPRRPLTRRHIVQGFVACVAGAIVLGGLARPYLALQAPSQAETTSLSADLVGYLLPPENTWLGQWLLAHTTLRPRWIWGEQTLFVGTATAVLSVIGIAALCHDWPRDGSRLIMGVFAAGVVALLLSFGPSQSFQSPYELLALLPGLTLIRAPARFALLVMMALALLTSFGARCLRSRGMGGAFALTALCILMLADAFVVGMPGGKPDSLPIPEVYRHLATLPRGAVVSLPSYEAEPDIFREADYLLFSTSHWFPIVNGSGRQAPRGHRELIETLAAFPSGLSAQRMRSIGLRYVVVHTGRARELRASVEEARRGATFRLLRSFDDGDYLFEVR